MASISGLSGTGSTSSLKGYGGLASGLDRDSLIEGMTAATRSKIAQQKQKKVTLGWQQTAMRSITSKMHEFAQKYTSYASSSNLLGSRLFSRTQLTANGANSKYLSVSGTASGSNSLSVLGVKQMAQNAQVTTKKDASTQSLSSGDIVVNATDELGTMVDVNKVEGQSIGIKYGSETYYVTLRSGDKMDYSSLESTVKAINENMKSVSVGGGDVMSDIVQASVGADGKVVFKSVKPGESNTIELAGGTGDVLKDLGFLGENETLEGIDSSRKAITQGGLVGSNQAEVIEQKSMADIYSGKRMNFTYNGTSKWITLGNFKKEDGLAKVSADMQAKLEEAFGKGRIQVSLQEDTSVVDNNKNTYKFQFNTTKPTSAGVVPDESSILTFGEAEDGLTGKMGVMKMNAGASNRLNLSSTIAESGLANFKDAMWDVNGKMMLQINDANIEISKTDKLGDVLNKINNDPKAGVTISYQSNSDRFILSSSQKGASGDINLSGAGAELLFGKAPVVDASGNITTAGDYSVDKGKDAIILVKYAGASQATEITRDSNTMTVDGLNIGLKGTFGYDAAGVLIADTEAVTFDSSVDVDNTTKVVKEMITAYNEMLELVNKEVKQKPNRNYQPLTDEQRAEMSETQIEKWEEEAKKGMFFNDSDLRSAADSMRFILPTQDRDALSKMGISVSSDYSDNGKLVFNEENFKTAMKDDPEAVKQVFTRTASVDADGNKIEAGLMTKMKTMLDKYASVNGSTKGIFIERAGSVYAPTSILANSYQKQLDASDKQLEKLMDRLETEQDRYTAQFTSLERLISQMNSQSSYLSGMFSG